ncbi:MAG TPA: amino acid adenylation domain-containing protein, partial [Longimicrobiaceae bacterium]|nr:amino acid adenylation domain-containing protein [Longimicrobiaceae bacterium]
LRVRGEVGIEQTNYPVVVTAEVQGELEVQVRYERRRVEGGAAERMAGHLEAVLEAMAAGGQRRLCELSLLRPEERAQVLEAWNATAGGYPQGCLHELFAAQAARTPDAVAVFFGGRSLSYAELERRSNRVAHALRRRGVGPDVPVGVCVERSAELVVGVLGVLKAGGAYLPLDPAYPGERLRLLLEDAHAPVLLTRSRPAGEVEGYAGAVLRLDDGEAVAGEPDEAPVLAVGARNLAYVVYTSGSTGTPKGVMIEHGSLSNYLHFFQREILGEEGFAIPLVSRLSFDAHVRQLFPPLLRGEAVWVLPEETATDPGRLLEALCTRERVSFGGVPSLWSAVLERIETGEGPEPGGLVAVLLGGEAVPPELVRRTRARFPGAVIWNHYGPTEATVNTTTARVEEAERITLGRAIANVRLYVLDGRGAPVPVGVPGELYVGGAGVARGYLGRAELTAERFVPDGFGPEAGGRLYRSGDRVRWLPTGELEYLGRVDLQVKVRGFRIEPEEIEAVLRRHPGVREAVVVAREDAPGQQRLVAYLVGEEGAGVRTTELREWLQERLPDYMVPSVFVELDEIPRNANGKTDRRALPEPEAAEPGMEYVERSTATEELLCGIWEDVLRAERVGPHANFFELGGHSLLATRVISRARRAFGVEVPLRALFEAPTVAALAQRIELLLLDGARTPAPPLLPVPRQEPLPLSFAQQRLWIVDRLEPASAAYNMPFALRLRGSLDSTALHRSLLALVRRHEVLRTVFPERDGAPLQLIHPPSPTPLPLLDLQRLPPGAREREAERLAEAEALRPFDLAAGPLLRCHLLRLQQQEHVLLFTLHHVVSDGWSTGVLVREVSTLYEGYARGEEPRLPELPVQYADYAAWQRSWLSGAVLEAQLAYWRERLAGAPPLLELPTDHPRLAGWSTRGGSLGFGLSAALSQGLRALGRREGATLHMVVLAGWQALLGRYAGQDDVVVGSPVSGRSRLELEGLIGFFVNLLALRGELGGDPTWSELVGRVREAALGAYAHQELPFEKLVEELVTERSLVHAPLFQVAYSLERTDRRGPLRLGAVALEPFGAGEGVAKFDLSLTVLEGGEELAGALSYRAALFEPATIARLAGHLERVLETMVAEPRRRLSEVSLLGAEERAQVLEACNATAAAYPWMPVQGLIAEKAARTPEAVAVRSGGAALSYAELERRAEALAGQLRGRGVGPEVRVGICVERGVEMVVGVLGVLKAGGVYVPLDPGYPQARLAYLVEDARCAVLLTQEGLRERLAGVGGEVLCLEQVGEAPGGGADGWRGEEVEGRSAAYVIYTSGSTGAPKGVVVEHAQLANFVCSVRESIGPAAGEEVLALASFSFDIWAFEVLVPLASGCTVHLLGKEQAREVPAVLEALRGASAVHAVPALMRQIVSAARERGAQELSGVRRV